MVGQSFSHYRIVKKLGEGGMGVVYKAEDTNLDRAVALKFLAAHVIDSEEHKQRFLREAKAAASLDHPNICTVYEMGESDGRSFLAMAYVDGVTVSEKVKERLLRFDEAVDIAAQAAQGLQAAHARGVVHRDIKSSNLMVTQQGQVRIMDFGLAYLASRTRLTKSETRIGTPAYMSPEQTQGEAVDHRTDIWSLGVVIYEMFTGRLLFEGEREQAVLYAIVNKAHEPITALRAGIPIDLDRVVAKAMAKGPGERYQHIEEMLVDLRALLANRSSGSVSVAAPALSRRKLVVAAGGIAAALAAGVAFNRERFFSGSPSSIESIAVLPIENLSADPEQEYFTDGLTEALITDLSKVGALKVISRTSVMQYKGARKALPEIARELGVDAVLEGSAQREGNTVRVTAQLIEAATDRHLWAESYERELTSVLALQSEVARAVVQEIRVQLTAQETKRIATTSPVNPEAYEAYLRGKFYVHMLTPEGLRAARKYFEDALRADPNSALAHSGIAEALIWSMDLSLVRPREAAPQALAAANRAIELDPELAQGFVSLGMLTWSYEWRWATAEAHYQKALELSPNNTDAHLQYAVLLTCTGREGEADPHRRRALELDPLNPLYQLQSAVILSWQGQHERAVEDLEKLAAKTHGMAMLFLVLWGALNALQRYDDAWAASLKGWSAMNDGEMVRALQSGYAEGGYREAMRQGAETLASRFQTTFIKPHIIAGHYDFSGDTQNAMRWLEQGYEEREDGMAYVNCVPFSNELRSSARFRALLERLNLPF